MVERKAMMQEWADLIDLICSKPKAGTPA